MADTSTDMLIENVKKAAAKKTWVLGLVAALLFAPLIWALAYAVLGVAFLGVATIFALIVGLVLVNGTPVLMMKAQNAKINAIIAEATKNPIPTLWAAHKADAAELDEMSKAIEDYNTEINQVDAKKRKLTADLTPADVEQFEADINAMKLDLKLQEEEYEEAVKLHEKQEVEIKRSSAIWDLSMAVNAANAKNVNRAKDTIAKIKRETALDAVSSSMSRSKAQLRQRINRRTAADRAGTGDARVLNEPLQVSYAEPVSILASTTQLLDKVKV